VACGPETNDRAMLRGELNADTLGLSPAPMT